MKVYAAGPRMHSHAEIIACLIFAASSHATSSLHGSSCRCFAYGH
jgi:hypothetical protein